MFAFVVQLVGLEFVIAILVLVFSGWNLYKTLKRPINVIVEQTLEFGASTPEKWMESNEWQKRKKIQTRDELQLVYDSVCESEKTICQKVISIRRNENELRQLSETDQMTRLYNRVSGEQKISEMISRNETGMLCILDFDSTSFIWFGWHWNHNGSNSRWIGAWSYQSSFRYLQGSSLQKKSGGQ